LKKKIAIIILIIPVIFIFFKITTLPKYSYQKFSGYFYLLFKENLNISNSDFNILNPFHLKLQGLYSEGFYAKDIKIDFFNNVAYINSAIISKNFSDKLGELINNYNLLLPIKKVVFKDFTFYYEDILIKKCFGEVSLKKDHLIFELNFFLNGTPIKSTGRISDNFQVNIRNSFDNLSLESIANLLDFESPDKFNIHSLKGEIIFSGSIKSKSEFKKNLKLNYLDYLVEVDISKSNDTTFLKDGVIHLPNNQKIVFNGETNSSSLYNLNFIANEPVSFIFKNFKFTALIFDLLISNESGVRKANINFNGESLETDKFQLSLLRDYIKECNGKISFKTFKVNNILLDNFESHFNYQPKKINIDKLNFALGEGKFMFTYLTDKNFQVAAEITNINIKNLLKIFDYNAFFDGRFNLSFIGEGADTLFSNGQGHFFIEDFNVNGVEISNLTNTLKMNGIFNIDISGKSLNLDHKDSLNFNSAEGLFSAEKSKLTFSKINLMGKDFSFYLYGSLDIKDYKNIILDGKFSDKDYSTNNIFNINFEKHLLQIIKK